MSDDQEFLARKARYAGGAGFEPVWMPDILFEFQEYLVSWAIRQGRSGVFADCGLGKSGIALTWAENVRRRMNKPVLLATPRGVTFQMREECAKFEVGAGSSRHGQRQTGVGA